MKHIGRALALTATVVVTGAVPAVAPAAASVPGAVTINIHRDGGDTWAASGTFTDSGSFVDDPAFFAGQSSTFHVLRAFTGADGSFSTRANVRISATADPEVLAVTGRWAVVTGTGAYEDLKGAGTISESFNTSTGLIEGTWTGTVLLL